MDISQINSAASGLCRRKGEIMKATGRIRLICRKKLPCGVIDKFEAVVSRDNESAARAKYTAMGYKVI